MSLYHIAVDVVLGIDVVACLLAVSIRRRVTRIIHHTADDIADVVRAGIADAVSQLTAAAAALFADRPDTAQLAEQAMAAADRLRDR